MPNMILIGQAEEIDLLQPKVREMLDNPGIYIAGDTTNPDLVVVLASQNGTVHSMQLDSELDPSRFLETLTLHGPYFAGSPLSELSFEELAEELRRRGATVAPAPYGGDHCEETPQ
ncbi:hypothetical protein [Burkholderia vietnamiensis]|uniref:hypothetical protein n=1 Tax=Burkholderia vietnamiensis TaxID=60552 RepID=UPI001593A9C4|nr:hypothetical protein [Burkholderia vietnamiensis]